MQKRGFITGAALAAAVVAATGAVAAVPDSSGVITSCRNTTDGTLRVIDTAKTTTCPAGTEKLQWSGSARVHWMRISADGRILAKSSSDGWGGSWGPGRYYAGWNGVDVTKCAISVTAGRHYNATPVIATVYTPYSHYTTVDVRGIKHNSWPIEYEWVNTEVNITANCGTSMPPQ